MGDGPARRLRWAVIGLVGLELLYVVAANSFLHHAWGRELINRRPEKLTVSWEGASTWLPGLVHVRGLDLDGTSRRVAWQARVDRATMLVWLPSLARRHFRVLSARAAGGETEVELLPPPEEPRPEQEPGWRVTLGGVRVEELRRVRVNRYELAGSGRLGGELRFQVRGAMELGLERLLFARGEVSDAGVVVASGLEVDGALHTRPYRPGRDRFVDLLGGASGRARLRANVQSLGFLSAYLRGVPWLGLDGAGDLDLDVDLDDGSLLPASRLSLAGPRVRADFFDLRARGTGRVAVEVPEAGGELRLSGVLDDYSLTRRSDGAELLVGEGFETRFASRSTRLVEPPSDVAGSLHLPSARVTSLAALAGYLPPGTAATVTGGAAELSLDLAYDTAASSGRGSVVVDARGATGTFGDAVFSGDVHVGAEIPSLDLLAGSFDLSGSTITVSEARFVRHGEERAREWWARVRVGSGSFRRPPAAGAGGATGSEGSRLTMSLEGRLRDTTPLVVLMEQRLPGLAWFDRLLTVPEIALAGDVALAGRVTSLRRLHVTGGEKEHLEIRAELDLEGEETSGAAYVRYRAIDATVVLDRGDRDWHLRRAARAYEEAVAEYRRGGGREGSR